MSTQRAKAQAMKILELVTLDIEVDKTPGKRNLAPENEDCQPSIKDKVEKKSRRTFLNKMDAIAYGVEAWLEENTGYSRRVTETTADIARALGVPEDEIERWAASRLIYDTEKFSVIKSLLKRLQGSSLAKRVNGKGHLRRRLRSQPTLRENARHKPKRNDSS